MESSYFLPPKKISVRALLPAWSVLVEYPLAASAFSSGRICAGTLATVSLPSIMLSSTFDPLPAHSTRYVPARSCLPPTVTVSATCSVPLLGWPAMALAASNNENVSRPAVNLVFLIRVSFPFVLASRKRIKILHSRRGKHDLTTFCLTRERASGLYPRRQKKWLKCIKKSIYLSHRFFTACGILSWN